MFMLIILSCFVCSFYRMSTDYGDDRFDADNSEGNSLSSGNDVSIL